MKNFEYIFELYVSPMNRIGLLPLLLHYIEQILKTKYFFILRKMLIDISSLYFQTRIQSKPRQKCTEV